jgi:ABC-2 type transport system permease protein
MGSVYTLTLRQLSGRWRLIIMTVLAALPVLFTVMVLQQSSAPFMDEFETIVLSTMLAGSIAPLIVVAIASVAFGNEVEDSTLANLTLAPIPRWQIVVPKVAASVTVAAPFILASALLTGWVAYNHDVQATWAVTVSALAGLVMYASAFVWLGLVTRQAMGVGLLYIVLWEGFFSGYVSGIRFLSIRHYAIALMHGLDPRRFPGDPHVGLGTAVAVTVGVCALFLWLSTRYLRRMDVP